MRPYVLLLLLCKHSLKTERMANKNYLRALAKGVGTAAGPLGAPAEFILSLYDDELAEKRDAKLEAILYKNQDISREALEQIFEIRDEIKEVRRQFINGLIACMTILIQNRQLLSSPQKLEIGLPALIGQHQEVFQENGFVTEQVLNQELSRIYAADPKLFMTTVGVAGFPLETIPQGDAPKVIVFHFVTRCSTLGLNQQVNIFQALSKENPINEPLRVITALLRERASNQ